MSTFAHVSYQNVHRRDALQVQPHDTDDARVSQDPSLPKPDEAEQSTSSPPPPPAASQRRPRPGVLVWKTEMASLVVAGAALAGMGALLARYDNKPLPQLTHGVTLNTVVSLLTQAFTVAAGFAVGEVLAQAKWLWFAPDAGGRGDRADNRVADFKLFNDAAHGAWGAAKLLAAGHVSLRSVLAPLGALLVLSMLVVGAFTQQLVHYRERDVVVAGVVASVPYAHVYDRYLTGGARAYKVVDLAAKAAFYNGVFNWPSRDMLAVTPTCVSGNCTWPVFSAIGICNTCVNSTADIIVSCSAYACNYSLPEDAANGIEPSVSGSSTADLVRIAAINKTVPGTAASRLAYYPSQLIRASMLFLTGYTGRDPSAVTCQMWACVKTYADVMVGSTLVEDVVSVFPNPGSTNLSASVFPGPSSNYINKSITPDASSGAVGGPFYLYLTYAPLQAFLTDQLVGRTSSFTEGEYSFDSDVREAFYWAQTDNYVDTGLVQETGETPDVYPAHYLMDSLALSLTNTMRSQALSANGTTHATQTFVHVEWLWMALPGAILILCLVALVLVVWQTTRRRVAAYKSESLVELFTDIADHKRRQIGVMPLATADDFVEASRKLDALLYPLPGEGRLVLG